MYLTTHAWLLKQIPLANDDALLIFLTDSHGLLKVFASKFQRSKTKAAEVDYFRWLELELTHPKQSYKLRKVKADADYTRYLASYERLQFGFLMLEQCAHFCPEEKPIPDLISLLPQLWRLEDVPLLWARIFFYTKLLLLSGVLPRFDLIRSDVWVHPQTLHFSVNRQVEGVFLTNHQRQLMEWLRRATVLDLLEKVSDFLPEDGEPLENFLRQVIENH